MAYIPPHMRQKNGAASSPPSPESMIPRFQRNLDLKSKYPQKKILHAKNCISKWSVVGLADENLVSSLAHLEPVSVESFERESGEKPLALVLNDNGKEITEFLENSWIDVAEAVKQDLFASFERVKNVMRENEFGEIRPTLNLRVGNILFRGSPSLTAESMEGGFLPVSTLKQLRKSFYTNVPPSYVEYITSNVAPQIVSNCEEEKSQKEVYHVKLLDDKRPGLTITCKCTFVKDRNQLEHRKIEFNQMRHMVADMSCLDKKLDVRLMLCTRKILEELTDEEQEGINSLVSSAILDSGVKGGLRWPRGKKSTDNRFTVVGVWHTNATTYRNLSTRLKVRHADRFDFLTSTGETANEVVLKMPGIVSLLQEEKVDTEVVVEMLKENLRLVWKHFLS